MAHVVTQAGRTGGCPDRNRGPDRNPGTAPLALALRAVEVPVALRSNL
ncbi:hypothetical protein AAHB34_08365 [Paenarthrobacter ureafaciens]